MVTWLGDCHRCFVQSELLSLNELWPKAGMFSIFCRVAGTCDGSHFSVVFDIYLNGLLTSCDQRFYIVFRSFSPFVSDISTNPTFIFIFVGIFEDEKEPKMGGGGLGEGRVVWGVGFGFIDVPLPGKVPLFEEMTLD